MLYAGKMTDKLTPLLFQQQAICWKSKISNDMGSLVLLQEKLVFFSNKATLVMGGVFGGAVGGLVASKLTQSLKNRKPTWELPLSEIASPPAAAGMARNDKLLSFFIP